MSAGPARVGCGTDVGPRARGSTTVPGVNPLETTLLYVVAPAGGLLLLALLTYGRSAVRAPRYRVGESWDHDPVWFMGNPKGSGVAEPTVEAVPSGSAPLRSARGGARGTW